MWHLFSFEFSRALKNGMVTDGTKIWQALVADRKLTSFLLRRDVLLRMQSDGCVSCDSILCAVAKRERFSSARYFLTSKRAERNHAK